MGCGENLVPLRPQAKRFADYLSSPSPAANLRGLITLFLVDKEKNKVDNIESSLKPIKIVVFLRKDIQMSYRGKRLFDIVFSLLFLVVFLPLMGLVAIVLRIFQGNPIIYCRKVVGLNGKPFIMFKFRTMINNADTREIQFFKRLSLKEGLNDDPRITKIGSFLRKISVDELPQFFNVLRGDMSVIGPRPKPEWMIDKFLEKRRNIYLSLKPGITGMVKATSRNLSDFSQEYENLEKRYYYNHSFKLDIVILFKTIFTLFKGR